MSQPTPTTAEPAPTPSTGTSSPTAAPAPTPASGEQGGRQGLDPVRYGDWEKNGRCIDF